MLADRRSQPLLALTAATAILLATTGCGAKHGTDSTTEGPSHTVEVVTLTDAPSGTITLPARVKAAEEATLTARIAARVSGFPIAEGRRVEAGAVLVRFDAPEARRALEAARADEQAARVAANTAARQHQRIESLHASGVTTQADLEAAESADRMAAARLAQASAAREIAEAAFEVRAPFAGVLVRRHVDAGADVMPGSPLVDLRSPGGTEIVTAVPEAVAGGLAEAVVRVQVDDGPWRPARLLRADGMVDPATRTRTARFAVREGAMPEPGAFARVRLETGSPAPHNETALAVPTNAVMRRGALTGVYVIEDGRAWLRWVRLGRTEGDRVEVLSGLAPGMRVAASAVGLSDGAVVSAPSESAAPATPTPHGGER